MAAVVLVDRDRPARSLNSVLSARDRLLCFWPQIMSRNVTIGKFNVKGGGAFESCGAAYHFGACHSDERKAPVQHALVGLTPQELGERRQLERLALQRILRTLRRPYRQQFQPFALANPRPGEQARFEPRTAIGQALAFFDNALPEAPLRAVARPD